MNQELETAVKHLIQALELIEGEKPDIQLLANIGLVYASMGKCYHAIQYLEQANKEYRGDLANNLGPVIKGHLAVCYCYIGEPSKAKKLLEIAVPQARCIGDERILGSLLLNKGFASSLLGEYEEAIRFFDQSMTYTNRNSMYYSDYVFATFNKVRVLVKLKRFDECHDALERGRPIVEGNELLIVLLNTANRLINLNDDSAISYVEDVAIPYLRALGGVYNFTVVDICKELESHYKRRKSKIKALTVSNIIREIYEELLL